MFRLGGSTENEGIMNGMRKRYEQGTKPEDIDSTYQEGDFNDLLQQAITENNISAVEYIQGQMLLRNMEITVDNLPVPPGARRFTDGELGG